METTETTGKIDMIFERLSGLEKLIIEGFRLKDEPRPSKSRKLTLRQIADIVCLVTETPYSAVMSKSRRQESVFPRQLIAHIASREFYYPSVDIATYLNHTHANILYSIKTIDNLLGTDPHTRGVYTACLYKIRDVIQSYLQNVNN